MHSWFPSPGFLGNWF
uniref:Uncharacterized protein n=1 Tax=Anguilla anguilla TaxID=7936 RepID=A0A0E9QBE5_ANGAN